MPKLIESYQRQVLSFLEDPQNHNKSIFIGGKSMGGRVASLLAIEKELKFDLSGVICLGFPFYPPQKPDKYRGAHLAKIGTPTLILQGERDTFGNKEAVDQFVLSDSVSVEYLPDGDHSFKPRVKSGVTFQENLHQSADKIVEFISEVIGLG